MKALNSKLKVVISIQTLLLFGIVSNGFAAAPMGLLPHNMENANSSSSQIFANRIHKRLNTIRAKIKQEVVLKSLSNAEGDILIRQGNDINEALDSANSDNQIDKEERKTIRDMTRRYGNLVRNSIWKGRVDLCQDDVEELEEKEKLIPATVENVRSLAWRAGMAQGKLIELVIQGKINQEAKTAINLKMDALNALMQKKAEDGDASLDDYKQILQAIEEVEKQIQDSIVELVPEPAAAPKQNNDAVQTPPDTQLVITAPKGGNEIPSTTILAPN